MTELFTHYAPLTSEEREASARRWEKLADAEEERLTWDRTYLPSMAANKAALYRKTAAEIRAEA